MIKSLNIIRFLELTQLFPVVDVRSPAEFAQGHIPGAINIPLFTDQERAFVGITYKQEGRNKAILKGLDFVGPKLGAFLEKAEKVLKEKPSQGGILIHCKRGGMRSGSSGWLLNLYGIQTQTLAGGYKSFRNFVLGYFKTKVKIIILSGFTGCGKTKILHFLNNYGEQIIDLEKLACHKGSAFGSLGEKQQPTQEQFENSLALEIFAANPGKNLWLEDESQMMGKLRIPDDFWYQMRNSPAIFLDIPWRCRKENIENDYGKYELNLLENCLNKIRKKLGGENTAKALNFLKSGNISSANSIILNYYDKMYNYSLSKRVGSNIFKLSFNKSDPEKNAKKILSYASNKKL